MKYRQYKIPKHFKHLQKLQYLTLYDKLSTYILLFGISISILLVFETPIVYTEI